MSPFDTTLHVFCAPLPARNNPAVLPFPKMFIEEYICIHGCNVYVLSVGHIHVHGHHSEPVGCLGALPLS